MKMRMEIKIVTVLTLLAPALTWAESRMSPIEACRSAWEAVGCTVPARPEPGTRPDKSGMDSLKSCIAVNVASITDSNCQSLPEPPKGGPGNGRPPGPPPEGFDSGSQAPRGVE